MLRLTPAWAANSLAVNRLSFHCSIRFTQTSRRSCLMPQTNTRLAATRQPRDPPNAYVFTATSPIAVHNQGACQKNTDTGLVEAINWTSTVTLSTDQFH